MNDQEKVFSILAFTRADLTRIGISDEQIASLTDEDLERIASDLRKIYTIEMTLDEVVEFQVKFHIVFKKG